MPQGLQWQDIFSLAEENSIPPHFFQFGLTLKITFHTTLENYSVSHWLVSVVMFRSIVFEVGASCSDSLANILLMPWICEHCLPLHLTTFNPIHLIHRDMMILTPFSSVCYRRTVVL